MKTKPIPLAAAFAISLTAHFATAQTAKQGRLDRPGFLGPPPTVDDRGSRPIQPLKLDGGPQIGKIRGHGGGVIAGPCLAAPAHEINPRFTTDLYAQLRTETGNVFFSPYSITQAMGMVYMGAKGDTAAEFVKAMGFGADQRFFGNQMEHLRNTLRGHTNRQDNQLNIANALCVTGATPLESYLKTVRTQFGAEVFNGGLDEINGWVKKKTEGNIDKILDGLSGNSACVLLNAVYFKGNWQTPFKPSNTHKATFHLSPGDSVDVDMMSREGGFKVLRNKGLIAVELPYQTSASMVLILPEKADGMKALEERLNAQLIGEVSTSLRNGKHQQIGLYMPKFKIATTYDLMEPMQRLGMADAFHLKKANFKAMYSDRKVAIGQIKHKATLEVDELGSVASAATAVEMKAMSARQPAPVIRFDRPFIVLIRENNTNSTLFIGRIKDPTAE